MVTRSPMEYIHQHITRYFLIGICFLYLVVQPSYAAVSVSANNVYHNKGMTISLKKSSADDQYSQAHHKGHLPCKQKSTHKVTKVNKLYASQVADNKKLYSYRSSMINAYSDTHLDSFMTEIEHPPC